MVLSCGSQQNIICLSHLPAHGGFVNFVCVFMCGICVRVQAKSLGISPSSRPFKCMRQYHTILATRGEMQVKYQSKKSTGLTENAIKCVKSVVFQFV